MIKEFMEGINQYPIHSNGLFDPPKALANIVESVIGAIFIYSNSYLEIVWKTFKKLADPLISLNTLGKQSVSKLYELCQKNKMKVSFEKDIWMKSMTVKVFVDGNLYGSGTYVHKKEIVQNRAAKAALDRLGMILQKAQIDSCYSTSG
ncbi:hypothetical protein M5K25_015658 [Dendrobium thyrsiflorum]|uniref:DRBM domain-containing protein n=1 Tax=Dendrobium thyrsiflorum TaxID=117978 RepID=A0ABD0URM5_DENTH